MKKTAKAALISAGVALTFGLSGLANADETTNLDEFDTIEITGGADVTVYPSSDFRIVALNDDAEDEYDVYVRRDKLYIECERRCSGDGEFAVYGSDINSLDITGGGRFTMDADFDSVGDFSVDITGGGKIDLSDISINTLSADITGGGVVETGNVERIEADITGGGIIEYEGDPKLSLDVMGGGTVRRKD